jgi:hypothetical protein
MRSSILLTALAVAACGGSDSRPASRDSAPPSREAAPIPAKPGPKGKTQGSIAKSSGKAVASSATTIADAVDVLHRYFAAIQRRDYDSAYTFWGSDTAAIGKTRTQFASGLANITKMFATIGDTGRVDGAAGSQYVTLPVSLDVVQRNDASVHIDRLYTLRRSMVKGATSKQRRWHIFKVELQR